jgi:hypothetical protein
LHEVQSRVPAIYLCGTDQSRVGTPRESKSEVPKMRETDREKMETGNMAEYSYVVAGMGIDLDLDGDIVHAHITPSGHLLLNNDVLPDDMKDVIDEVLSRKTVQFGLLNLKTGTDVIGDINLLNFTIPG